MPPLTPGDVMTLGGMLVIAVSSFVGVREQVKGVRATQQRDSTEILRQLGAVHKRLDDFGRRLVSVELEQARQDEWMRIKELRLGNRHRFRPATAESGEGDEG